MSAPKCKGCTHLMIFTKSKSGYKYRQCAYKVMRAMNANEFKTSPKWCPKRGYIRINGKEVEG